MNAAWVELEESPEGSSCDCEAIGCNHDHACSVQADAVVVIYGIRTELCAECYKFQKGLFTAHRCEPTGALVDCKLCYKRHCQHPMHHPDDPSPDYDDAGPR